MAKWEVEDGLEYFDADARPQTVTEMVREFAIKTEQKALASLYENLIHEEYKEWYEETEDVVSELKELADLVYVIYGYANAKGFDLEEAVRRVHENNLGRCIQPDGTVKRRADGKILKNPYYPKVTLGDLVCRT